MAFQLPTVVDPPRGRKKSPVINRENAVQQVQGAPDARSANTQFSTTAEQFGSGLQNLEDVGATIGSFAQDEAALEQARNRAQAEANARIEGKLDKNRASQLTRKFTSFTKAHRATALQETDLSNPTQLKNFTDAINNSAATIEEEYDGSDLGFLDFKDQMDDLRTSALDNAFSDSLNILNETEKNNLSQALNSLRDPGAITKLFDTQLDPIQSLIDKNIDTVNKSKSSIDAISDVTNMSIAMENAESSLFDHHMRNGNMQASEDIMDDIRFDGNDGSDARLKRRDRLQKARTNGSVTVFDNVLKTNVLVPRSEVDPTRHEEKRDLKKVNNLSNYTNALIQNDEKKDSDITKLSREEIASNHGITIRESTQLEKQLDSIEEQADKFIDDPIKKEQFIKQQKQALQQSLEIKTPASTALDKANETKERIQAENAVVESIDDPELKKQVSEEFDPTTSVKTSSTAEMRKSVAIAVTGKPAKLGEDPVLDNIQKKNFREVLALAEKIKEEPGVGDFTAVDRAIKKIEEKRPGFINENIVLTRANEILGRRESGGPGPEPLSADIPDTFTGNDLNEELDSLISSQKGIKVANTSGILSGFKSFLTNLPGQFFTFLQDQETIRARTALLRVSREILTLTMKNDRFAIAEQEILTGLLSGPELLTNADSVKTKLRSFQEELRIEIARSARDIRAGVNAGENLDKLVDYDRIDSLLDQFDLSPGIAHASPAEIEGMNSTELTEIEDNLTPEDFKNLPQENKDALLNRQKQENEKLGLSPEQNSQQTSDRDIESSPQIVPETQSMLDSIQTLPELESLLNSFTGQLAQQGGKSPLDIQALEQVIIELEHNIANFDSRGDVNAR